MGGARVQRRAKRGRTVANAETAPSEGPASRLIAINGLVPIRDRQMLQFLSQRSRVPQSEYLREALRDLLRKYRDSFDDSPFQDDEPL